MSLRAEARTAEQSGSESAQGRSLSYELSEASGIPPYVWACTMTQYTKGQGPECLHLPMYARTTHLWSFEISAYICFTLYCRYLFFDTLVWSAHFFDFLGNNQITYQSVGSKYTEEIDRIELTFDKIRGRRNSKVISIHGN